MKVHQREDRASSRRIIALVDHNVPVAGVGSSASLESVQFISDSREHLDVLKGFNIKLIIIILVNLS